MAESYNEIDWDNDSIITIRTKLQANGINATEANTSSYSELKSKYSTGSSSGNTVNWRESGLVQDPKIFEPTQTLAAGMNSSSSEKKYEGDDADKPLESFEQCKHPDYNYTSEDHPIVKHKCIYADIYGRCTRDECVYDAYETSKVCNKHWDTCILCGNTLTVPPNMMDVPFCDKCKARLLFAETLPFTCLLCGKRQNRPSKAPFSQICDRCFKNYIYCPNCRHWCQISKSPAEGYDKL